MENKDFIPRIVQEHKFKGTTPPKIEFEYTPQPEKGGMHQMVLESNAKSYIYLIAMKLKAIEQDIDTVGLSTNELKLIELLRNYMVYDTPMEFCTSLVKGNY